jgi:folate-binding protein YgfZ
VIPPSFDATAVVDLSRRSKLRVVGADRVRFLNGQVSNDVRRASETGSIYTCVMTIKGKMCADAFIHSSGEALLLDAEPEVRETLSARLERYIIADDVTLEDVSDEIGLLHLFPFGAGSPEAAGSPVLPAPPPGCRYVRSERYGRPGLDFFALGTRRILAGIPKWGAELDENTMPAEAGLEERAVSYTKGCYIGQEVVSRVKSVGHVNRHLRGLRSIGAVSLTPGLSLYPTDTGTGGRAVGQVKSVAPDPADERASIALAFVRRGWEGAGTVLTACSVPSHDPSQGDLLSAGSDLPGDECRAVVCDLPFI